MLGKEIGKQIYMAGNGIDLKLYHRSSAMLTDD